MSTPMKIDPATQAGRILAFIRANPGCTTMQIQKGLDPWCSNPRARISDLRAVGYQIDCRKRGDGVDGFWLVEQPEQLTWSAA